MSHGFFEGLDFAKIRNTDPPFIPVLEDACDTSYFDNRELEDFQELLEDENGAEAVVYDKSSDPELGQINQSSSATQLHHSSLAKQEGTSSNSSSPIQYNANFSVGIVKRIYWIRRGAANLLQVKLPAVIPAPQITVGTTAVETRQ